MRKENNIAIIRLTAAFFVFAGHMGILLGGSPPLLGSFSLHETGVFTLFLLSGYLISTSWLSDPHPLRFAVRRFFRLWPPFAVMILIMVFVTGPLLSELGVQGYFESAFYIYLRNLRFYPVYSQPGVFTSLPVAGTTNGSIWTMPVEAALYIITPVLFTIFRVKKDSPSSQYILPVFGAVALAVDVLLRIFCADTQIAFYGVDLIAAAHLCCMYFIGMAFTSEKVRKYLNIQAAFIAMALLHVFQFASAPVRYPLFCAVLSYFVFSLAFAPAPVFRNIGRKLEPSYGIYLYGFFFQQLTVTFMLQNGITPGYCKTFLISAVPTLAAAALSYFLIEKPSQRIARRLLKRLRKNGRSIC